MALGHYYLSASSQEICLFTVIVFFINKFLLRVDNKITMNLKLSYNNSLTVAVLLPHTLALVSPPLLQTHAGEKRQMMGKTRALSCLLWPVIASYWKTSNPINTEAKWRCQLCIQSRGEERRRE